MLHRLYRHLKAYCCVVATFRLYISSETLCCVGLVGGRHVCSGVSTQSDLELELERLSIADPFMGNVIRWNLPGSFIPYGSLALA